MEIITVLASLVAGVAIAYFGMKFILNRMLGDNWWTKHPWVHIGLRACLAVFIIEYAWFVMVDP